MNKLKVAAQSTRDFVAFDEQRCIALGDVAEVVRKTKDFMNRGHHASILIFDAATSQQIEIDFRGTIEDVLARLRETGVEEPLTLSAEGGTPARGRPRLGVVPREVTLLPRHWEWLNSQPGGASAVLRRLVEEASRTGRSKERARRSLEAIDRFMRVVAGDLPGYEEASRSLYRKDWERFNRQIEGWPPDVRDHLQRLAATALWDHEVSQAT